MLTWLNRYNVRKFRYLPSHLAAAERTMNLNDDVLFNYSWLYHKCRACSFDELMHDFTFGQSQDTSVVERALRAARPYIGGEAESLAPELAGRLLPFIGTSAAIRRLITDCDRSGVQRCALVPNFPYRQTSGGALQDTIVVDGQPKSYAVAGEDRRLLLVKDVKSSSIQVKVWAYVLSFSFVCNLYASDAERQYV